MKKILTIAVIVLTTSSLALNQDKNTKTNPPSAEEQAVAIGAGVGQSICSRRRQHA